MKTLEEQHKGRLHRMAVKWLKDRANPEEDGGLGVFAGTRYCLELTELLRKVEKSALSRSRCAGR